MKRIILAAFAVVLVLPSVVTAEVGVKFSAQVRHRLEVDNRDFNSDTGVASLNLLRTRLNAKFVASDNAVGFVQLQDSRFWGQEPGTLANTANVDVHQAFFMIKNLWGKPIDAKVGRMEFNLGPQRLIGAVGWDNVGRAFDGALLGFRRDDQLHVKLWSFTEVDMTPLGAIEDAGDKYVNGASVDLLMFEDYTVQGQWIWQRWSPSRYMNRHTLGFYAAKKGRFHHETEFAAQLGDIGFDVEDTDSTTIFIGRTVSAFFAALNLGYSFPDVAGKPDVTVGVDYLSGQDGATDYKVFDTLYATNHKYYGFMDYFLNIPKNTLGLGLVDMHGKVAVSPAERTWLKAAFHVFQSAEEVIITDETGTIENATSSFGNELDLTLVHKYDDNVSFTVGASVFMPGDIFEIDRGEDTSTWFYLMTAFNMK